MSLQLTTKLRNEYESLWNSAQLKYKSIIRNLIDNILQNKNTYISVSVKSGVPWEVIAVIHALESSLNFNTHLHNGDKLTDRTHRVPKGRPKHPNPPYTWEDSALDALGLKPWDDWSISGTLFFLEMYNGFGYRYRGINSPYLWSFTNHYTKGKYVKDGVFDPEKVSRQIGAVALLKELDYPTNTEENFFSKVPQIYWGKDTPDLNKKLQIFLNSLNASFDLLIDGHIGRKTSDAFFHIFGQYVHGDPRNI